MFNFNVYFKKIKRFAKSAKKTKYRILKINMIVDTF